MRAKEIITELFKNPQAWKWAFKGSEEAFARFTIEGVPYLFHAYSSPSKPRNWEIEFSISSESMPRTASKAYGITGTGNAAAVMGAVVGIMKDFINSYKDKIDVLEFTAEEDSRTALYARMLQRLLPTWKISQSARPKKSTGANFILTSPEVVTEAKLGFDDAQEHTSADQEEMHSQADLADTDELADYADESNRLNSELHNSRRGNRPPATKYKQQIKAIDAVLQKKPLTRELVVYSGLLESPENAYTTNNVNSSYPIRLHLVAYTSTSTDFKEAIYFARKDTLDVNKHRPLNYEGNKPILDGRHVLRITLPVGTPAGSIMKQSIHSDEKEILLSRGAIVEVEPNPVMTFGLLQGKNNNIFVWSAKVVGFDIKKL